MKIRAVAVSALLIVLLLAVTPSFADTQLYSNGPLNGTGSGWIIDYSWAMANSFTLTNPSTITSFLVGLSVFSDSVPISTNWAITTAPDFSGIGGTAPISGTGAFTYSLVTSGNPFTTYNSTVSGLSVFLGPGTYYLELFNATSTFGNPAYWEENDGPSKAFVNTEEVAVGSEAFTIYGTADNASATPEPSTMLMFGTGALGLLGAIRRRFCI